MKAQRVEYRPTELGLAYAAPPVGNNYTPADSSGSETDWSQQHSVPQQPPSNEPLAFGCLVVGRDVHVTGALSVPGSLRVEGRIDGEVEANELVILSGGTIVGDVVCDLAILHGTLSGTLQCAERLTVLSMATVEGEIVYHKELRVDSGAHLNCAVKFRSEPLPIHRAQPTEREAHRPLAAQIPAEHQRASLMSRVFGASRQPR